VTIDYVLGGELYAATPEQLPSLSPTNPPVAVLTSPMTASAGEIVAAAFGGKPHTRTFGEPTVGLFTQMRGYPLWDGAYLNVAVGRALDAAGHPHDGPLAPDEAIETTFVGFGSDQDPVLQRARAWLTTSL
jgi:C-terminal processing protease CtpA/Prc